MVTPVIWSGPCSGVNLIASRRVRIGANRTTPRGPTLPPRTWPPEPATSTCSRPVSPGVRCTVIRRTLIRCRQPMVSTGCASVVLAIQVVAGLPSAAARAWSRGSAVKVDDARAHTARRRPLWPVPGYVPPRTGVVSTACPRSVALPASGTVNAWSKPYCSSVGTASTGEHTQRTVVRMQPLGQGWALASTTAAGRVPAGGAGATITRPSVSPGTVSSLIATWVPNPPRPATPVTVSRSHPVRPGGTRSGCARPPVARTRSVTWPAAVAIVTWLTAGPTSGRSANATEIVPGSAGSRNRSRIHWPTGPFQLPDSQAVRGSPSTAANGCRPLAHSLGMDAMSAADEDADTSLIPPRYRATAWYRSQAGSV